jgi:predicted transglutaminase-like cysteine proteinase
MGAKLFLIQNFRQMAYRFEVIGRFAVLVTAVAGLLAGSCRVEANPFLPTPKPLFTAAVEKANPPPGWAEFCANYVSECEAPKTTRGIPRSIVLTQEMWETITAVNQSVNTSVQPVPDRIHRGRPNVWAFAEDGRGDCKDYVLVKRQKLIEAGLPPESLLVTIVWTPHENGHAVLIARTDRGDFVLDNLSPTVVIWSDTPYQYVERQSDSDPNAWVYIDGHPPRADEVWIAHGLI